MDAIIRIWDLPTGHLIDGIKTKSIVTALAWSGRGEFLVTGHVDDVGVSLWYCLLLFPSPTVSILTPHTGLTGHSLPEFRPAI